MYRDIDADKKKYLVLIAIAATIALFGWIVFSPEGAFQFFVLKKKASKLQEENAVHQHRNKNLREEIDRLGNDMEYLGGIAREEFHMLRKNEIIFDFSQKRKHR